MSQKANLITWERLAQHVKHGRLKWGLLVGEMVKHNKHGSGKILATDGLEFCVSFDNGDTHTYIINLDKNSIIATEKLFPHIEASEKLRQMVAEAEQLEEAEAEEERRREAKQIQRAEEERKLAAQQAEEELQNLLQKYRADPRGIRNEPRMRAICLQCGSRNVTLKCPEEYYVKHCQDCGSEWYTNHCWNCDDGLVDRRDPETPKCHECGWYRCYKCGACRLDGCSTNPYHRGNRLRDYKIAKIRQFLQAKNRTSTG